MVWILLLVHITLHGMIGGLLKHVPKAVCRIVIFICENTSECGRRKLFSFYLRLNVSLVTIAPRAQAQFELREEVFFPFCCRVTAPRAACFCL